jgi:preprotein translocase subunit YajC
MRGRLTPGPRSAMIRRVMPILIAAAPATAQSPNALVSFLPMILIFGIFYFILIAPMRKRQKKTQQMLAQLKKGDAVITNGGIYGRISAIDDATATVILQVSDQVKIKIARSALAGLQGTQVEISSDGK